MDYIKYLPKCLRGEIVKHLDVHTLINLGWLNIIRLVLFGKNQLAAKEIMENLTIADIVIVEAHPIRISDIADLTKYKVELDVDLPMAIPTSLKSN